MSYRMWTFACLVIFAAVLNVTTGCSDSSIPPNTLALKGVLLKKADNSPLAGKEIFFIPIERDGSNIRTVVAWKDSKISNPSALSDANGRFTVLVPNNYEGRLGEFSVGLDPSRLGGPRLLNKGGASNLCKADLKTKKIDLGKILVDE